MDLYENQRSTSKIKRDASVNDRIPDGLFLACPYCGTQMYNKQLGDYRVCAKCGYGFRLQARERVALLTDNFEEMDADIEMTTPDFPGYAEKLARAKSQTDLGESVLTGVANIEGEQMALGVMDSYFMMGSLGSMTGEKITRLFEYATAHQLPVVLFTASGGARMMAAAVANKPDSMKLLAVTQLTSFSESEMQATQLTQASLVDTVTHLAAMAFQVGVDGTISSPEEAKAIQAVTSQSFVRITPGIRLLGDDNGDQRRVTTPQKARHHGATGLVVGRSITQAVSPLEAYQRVLQEWCKD